MQELDPRIYGLADTPDVIAERGAKLQEAQDKVRQMRQAAQDAQATRQAFQQWTDPQTGITDYVKVIGQVNRHNPAAGTALQKFFDEHLEKMAQREKQEWENVTAENNAMGSVASSIHDQAGLDAWRKGLHPTFAAALPELYDDAGKARIAQLVQASKNADAREKERHDAFEEWQAIRKEDREQPEFIAKSARIAAEIVSNSSVDDGTAFLKTATTLGFPPQAITPLFSKTPEEAAQMALTPNERAVRADAKAGRDLQTNAQAETKRYHDAEINHWSQEVKGLAAQDQDAVMGYIQQLKVDPAFTPNMVPAAGGMRNAVISQLHKEGYDLTQPVTTQTRARVEFAKAVQPQITAVRNMAQEIDKMGLMGSVGGRWRQLVSGESSASALSGLTPAQKQTVGKFVTQAGLLVSGLGVVHGGARGGGSIQMIEQLGKLLDPKGKELDVYLGNLSAANDVVGGYAHMADRPGTTPAADTPAGGLKVGKYTVTIKK